MIESSNMKANSAQSLIEIVFNVDSDARNNALFETQRIWRIRAEQRILMTSYTPTSNNATKTELP